MLLVREEALVEADVVFRDHRDPLGRLLHRILPLTLLRLLVRVKGGPSLHLVDLDFVN